MKSRIPALDGLRGFACFLVFMGHFITSNSHMGLVLPRVFSQFWSGVDLFFVLSGFVIFLSLHRLREASEGRWDFFKTYFAFRFWRIAPVYLLLILSYILIPLAYTPLAQCRLFVSSIPDWCYFVFGQSVWAVIHQHRGADYVNVTWSLCAEVFFYGMAFLLVLFVPSRKRIRALVALVALSYLARVYFAIARNDLAAAYLFPVCRMDGFMLGGIAAILYLGGRLPLRARAPLDGALLPMTLLYCFLAYYGQLQSTMFSVLFSYAFYSLFYCLVVVRCISVKFGVLAKGPLAYFGVISYFVYLFQVPALSAVEAIFEGPLLIFASSLLLVAGAASLSWVYFERPLIRMGRSLAARSA
jgi:peptidoglycan/LPS O-acetylase OafA/YrhL